MTCFRGYLLPKLNSWRLNLQEKQNESCCCNHTKDKKIKCRRWWWMQLLLQQCFCLCDGIILIYSIRPSTRTGAASLTNYMQSVSLSDQVLFSVRSEWFVPASWRSLHAKGLFPFGCCAHFHTKCPVIITVCNRKPLKLRSDSCCMDSHFQIENCKLGTLGTFNT
jgi:hypothetical protein